MSHEIRDGCRGGRDKFKWDDLKNDRSKKNYLGNSVKAPSLRGKDAFWYSKTGSIGGGRSEEIQKLREKESKMMEFYLENGVGASLDKVEELLKDEDKKEKSATMKTKISTKEKSKKVKKPSATATLKTKRESSERRPGKKTLSHL